MSKVIFTLLQNIIKIIKTMCCLQAVLKCWYLHIITNLYAKLFNNKTIVPLSNKWFKGSQFMCSMLLMNIIMDILCYRLNNMNFAGAKFFINHKKKLKLACVCMFCGLGKLISIYCFFRVSEKGANLIAKGTFRIN